MANPENVERAFFQIKGSQEKIIVDFNPESLQYTIANNLENKGKGNKKKQYISDSTAKLTIDLIFDTTGLGEDVRLKTIKVAKFMEPNIDKAPPEVSFEWGLYTFRGMVESYKETIDYFSANGVPLRASVNITMSSQDKVFEGGSDAKNAGTGGSAGLPNSAIPVAANNGKGATDVATKGGDPGAGKTIAGNNGLENMRFPGTASLEIGGSAVLKPPAAFASGGLSISASADLDSGVAAEIGISGGLDANVSLNPSLNLDASVNSASAFSGLRKIAPVSGGSASLNLDNFLDTDSTSNFGVDVQSSFGLGGGAGLQGSASLKAEVGQGGEFKTKIEFDGG